MFNLGAGEVAMMICLALIFLSVGTIKNFPDLTPARASRANRNAGARRPASWSRCEWFLVTGALLLVSLVVALAAVPRDVAP